MKYRSSMVMWRLIGSLVICAGVSGSWVVAKARVQSTADAHHARNAKQLSEIAARADLALQRELDLTTTARPFFSDEAGVTSRDVESWAATISLHEGFPEVLGVGLVRFVPPSGDRTFSCVAMGTVSFSDRLPDVPIGTDLCSLGLAPAVIESRDSGQSSVVASSALFGQARIMIQSPLYRGGAVPTTIDERRARFLGNVGILVEPAQLLAGAYGEYPTTPIALTYRDGPATKYSFLTDPEAKRDLVLTVDLGDGWSISTSDPGARPSLRATPSFFPILGIGSLVSVLLALLVYTLATGRLRAVRIVEQRTAELRELALHDSLTGLPNRTLILERIDTMLATCAQKHAIPAVLYIDLDGFKSVNDTLGHLVGDQLLLNIADRLCSVFRQPDTVGRIGGDEFVALISVDSIANAEAIASRVLTAMRAPVILDLDGQQRPVYVTASVGIAAGTRATSSELLRDADLALYRAKALGSDCYQTFRPEMRQIARELLEIESELRNACERQEFELHYQPIYTVNDLTLVGVEALLRWNHPVIGTISPDRFIPLLEHNGQIVNVGRWVLNEACQQAAAWRRQGHDLNVSVNVSGRQLDREAIVTDIQMALDSSGLEADTLTIEITETALIRDPAATADRLTAIKALGVHVSIDDFGTGYCSLAYLQRFAVDGIKIDRSFTQAIGSTTESNALVRTLVQLANDLGAYTLAEGVETIEQLDQLRGLQVDQAQGFLLARPLTARKIQESILSPTARTHRNHVVVDSADHMNVNG